MVNMHADLLAEICNYLLNHSFVIGNLETTKEIYYTILNNEEELQRTFRPLGYTVSINRALRVAHLVNLHGAGRMELRKYESILLLILRLLYVEKRETLSVSDHLVIATVEEVTAEYGKLNLPRKLDQRMLEDALRLFKKYNLAFTLDRLEDTSSRIQILPSIMLAMPEQSISKAADETRAFLMQYQSASSADDGEEDENSD